MNFSLSPCRFRFQSTKQDLGFYLFVQQHDHLLESTYPLMHSDAIHLLLACYDNDADDVIPCTGTLDASDSFSSLPIPVDGSGQPPLARIDIFAYSPGAARQLPRGCGI